MSGVLLGIIALFAIAISIPLLIYHFLVFPNVDGFINDLGFYNADEQSQHFLYWFWFWTIAFGSGFVVSTRIKT